MNGVVPERPAEWFFQNNIDFSTVQYNSYTHLKLHFFRFRSKTIDENEIKIKIEPIQIYENSTTPKYGNKRLQGFRPGFGQGNVRDLAGQLKPKALYQKNTSASPTIKLSCGKTQNDTAVS